MQIGIDKTKISNLKNKGATLLFTKKMFISRITAQLRSFTARPATTTIRYTSQINKPADTPAFDMDNPFEKEKQVCILCKYNITPDYKNVKLLSQFQSPYTGRIYGPHITGLCENKQAQVEAEIVKAQSAGLMATYLKELCFVNDPKLFDSENPIRPHRF